MQLIFAAFVLSAIASLEASSASLHDDSWHWTWTCNNLDRCDRKYEATTSQLARTTSDALEYTSLAACRLVCGKFGALWPKPTVATTLEKTLINFHPNQINFEIANAEEAAQSYLTEAVEIFRENIYKDCGTNCSSTSNTAIAVQISITNSDLTFNWETKENYTLNLVTKGAKVVVQITGENVFGARHGLETLTQLIASYPIYPERQLSARGLVMVTGANIQDKPAYRHRGLLLDTARNYLPINAIKRQINAMAASKLNVLHWHATDSQSFPLVSPRVPLMSRFGAYSSKKVYQPDDIRELLRYAKVRGVRIILEIDAPSHAGNGWQWGPQAGVGNLSVCINQLPWRSYCIQPPCGQLNPINPHVYNVLAYLYQDFTEIFPKGEVFHMGGDEVFFPCWNTTEEIIRYLKDNGRGRTTEDFLDLWGEYQAQALKVYDETVGNQNTPIILWSSALTDPEIISKYLSPQRYIIETWVPSTDSLPQDLLNKGYKLIISTKNAWYLDHGFWGNTLYYTWRKGYSNRLPRHQSVLGGEVCMWGELVDENTVDNRVWPRAAAAAERLWSDPETDTASAESRFYIHRDRLITRGIQPEALAPGWCYQNEGECT